MLTLNGYVSGQVQGVGFRYFVKLQAQKHNIHGYAKNLCDGRVEFLLQGNDHSVRQLMNKIHIGPSSSKVDAVESQTIDTNNVYQRFKVE